MNVKMNLPLLPLRDIVVFPNMVIPLFVGRDKSINALNDVMSSEKKILLVSQFRVGTLKRKDDPIMLEKPYVIQKQWGGYEGDLLGFECIDRERPQV